MLASCTLDPPFRKTRHEHQITWDHANMTASAPPTNNTNMAFVRTSEVVNTHTLYFHIYILELGVNISRIYILITVKILHLSSYFFRKSTFIKLSSITPIDESSKLTHIIKQSPFLKNVQSFKPVRPLQDRKIH
jgi:hypothetical protein